MMYLCYVHTARFADRSRAHSFPGRRACNTTDTSLSPLGASTFGLAARHRSDPILSVPHYFFFFFFFFFYIAIISSEQGVRSWAGLGWAGLGCWGGKPLTAAHRWREMRREDKKRPARIWTTGGSAGAESRLHGYLPYVSRLDMYLDDIWRCSARLTPTAGAVARCGVSSSPTVIAAVITSITSAVNGQR